MFKWIKKRFAKKKKFVTNKEIKALYKNMSKNQLIRIINTLVTENVMLKKGKIQKHKNKVDISRYRFDENGQDIDPIDPGKAPELFINKNKKEINYGSIARRT